jgi:hypothetical protein
MACGWCKTDPVRKGKVCCDNHKLIVCAGCKGTDSYINAHRNPLWNDNLLQFARLLSEITATQDNLDYDALCESMDLELVDVAELFERAQDVWEAAKAMHGRLDTSGR